MAPVSPASITELAPSGSEIPVATTTVPAPTTPVDPAPPVVSVPRTDDAAATSTIAPLAGVPTGIRLPGAGSAIPVVPVGVSADGVLDPPDDVATAGWWVAGPRPGGPGRTLITGHIDSRTQGIGAFAALDAVGPGDRFTVTTADGHAWDYVVTGRDEIVKSQLDPAILRGTDAPDLLLVTCIGVFDTDTRSYASNLLVTATPVSS